MVVAEPPGETFSPDQGTYDPLAGLKMLLTSPPGSKMPPSIPFDVDGGSGEAPPYPGAPECEHPYAIAVVCGDCGVRLEGADLGDFLGHLIADVREETVEIGSAYVAKLLGHMGVVLQGPNEVEQENDTTNECPPHSFVDGSCEKCGDNFFIGVSEDDAK